MGTDREAAGDALRQRLLAEAERLEMDYRKLFPPSAEQPEPIGKGLRLAKLLREAAACLSPQLVRGIDAFVDEFSELGPSPLTPRGRDCARTILLAFAAHVRRMSGEGESAPRAPSETPAMESIPEFVEDRFFVEPTVYGYGVFYRDESTQKKLGVGCAQNVDEAVAKIVARSLNGVVYDAVTGGDPRPAERATGGETHRCSGCGHRWEGPHTGAELCGDCWRRGQAVILQGATGGETPPAVVRIDALEAQVAELKQELGDIRPYGRRLVAAEARVLRLRTVLEGVRDYLRDTIAPCEADCTCVLHGVEAVLADPLVVAMQAKPEPVPEGAAIRQLIAKWREQAKEAREDRWCNTEDAPVWRSIHQHRAEVFEQCADELEALLPSSSTTGDAV